jgi:hypothetical protein
MLDRLLPLPKGGKDLTVEENGASIPLGNYADIALTFNNLLFAIFTLLYLWLFVTSMVF